MTFWPNNSDMLRVLPPKPKTIPDRPKKKRIRAAHENKNPNKEHVVEEQASDFDVEGFTENYLSGSRESDVEGSRQSNVGGSSDVRGCNQFGLRRGRRVKATFRREGPGYTRGFVPAKRFSQLSRWFELGENDMESDPIEDSKVALETNQNAKTGSFTATHDTLNFSDTAFTTTQNSQNQLHPSADHNVAEQEPQAVE
nr:pentatricopeptide repeat-containing protein [Tanacetum cinerariifolium]